jgi:O-antigen/teichoic acid export membrane protein
VTLESAPAPTAQHDDGALARNVAVTTGSLVAARGIALIAGIGTVTLASRYLGLAHFGALSAAMAYASLFALLTDMGLSTVATREIVRTPSRERHVLGGILGIGLVCAVAFTGLGLALMELIYRGPANASTREAIVILLAQVLVAPFVGVARAFLTARQRGYLIAFGDLALAVGMAAFTAIAVISHLGYHGVVIGITGGYLAQAVVMAGVALGAGIRVGFGGRTGLALLVVALPLAVTMLFNYLYFRLDLLLLSWIKTDVQVAQYGLAYRVIEGLIVLPSYVMLALFPAITRREGDQERLSTTVGAALGGLEAIALPITALLAIFAPEIVVVLGGHKYVRAAPVLAILALALGLSYLNGVFGSALLALGQQRRLVWLTMAALGINVVVNLLLIPPWGIIGAAVAVVISEVAALAIVRGLYVSVAGAPRRPPNGRILAAGVPLGVLAAIKFALPLGSKPLLVLAVGIPLGGLLYSALLLRLGALPPAVTSRLRLPAWAISNPPHG